MFNPRKRSVQLRQTLAPNGETILVTVARLAPEKGFEFLARVARDLDKREFPFKIVIVGGNRSVAVVEEIHGMYGDLATRGKVSFAGFQTGEKLAEYYASADIFLHCSITETFGLVVLESMASGVPVIARDQGGPSEIVVDSKTGYLVHPADQDGFVRRIVEVGSDAVRRQRMGLESRRIAETATWNAIGNRVAWKMVDALEGGKSSPTQSVGSKTVNGWFPLRSHLRTDVASAITSAKLLGALVMICGAWSGLILTWGIFKLLVCAKTTTSWVRKRVAQREDEDACKQ